MEIKDELLTAAFMQEPLVASIGQSACGKGTLSASLEREFQRLLPTAPFLYSGTGDLFRDNIPQFSEWNRTRIAKRQDAGYLQPWSTASALWARHFLDNYQGGPVFIDGSPRSLGEVQTMIDFFCGYVQKRMIVFHLEIDDVEAERRMIVRNDHILKNGGTPRPDTATPEARAIKLAYFHTLVVPALAYLKTLPEVSVINIDATQSKESVAHEVLSYLQFYPNM